MSAFYCRAFLSGDMYVVGIPHHTGLHSGYPGLMPIAAGGQSLSGALTHLQSKNILRGVEFQKRILVQSTALPEVPLMFLTGFSG
jgi:hypothetical protein